MASDVVYGVMRFAEKLDTLITSKGTNQSRLSRQTGIAQSAISQMTKGSRRPYMDQAFLLSQALGVPLDYLADDEQDEPPKAGLDEWEAKVLEIVREIGPQVAWRRLIGSDPVEPRLVPPPKRPKISDDAG